MCSIYLTSCGGDDNDDPEVPDSKNVTTNYGVVKTTGIKTISLFASAHDGETTLTIPGFAPIRLATEYNIYKHINVSYYLYADDMGNDFATWYPGNKIPLEFEDTNKGNNVLIRTKVKNSDKYVYAYIERIRYLEESTGGMDGNVIGGVLKYTSPIDPATFTGFPEKD